MQSSSSRTVFLNPNFRNTHINPNFLIPKPSSSIHINPEFLQKLHSSETAVVSSIEAKGTRTIEPMAKVILKSRTKLVREPGRVLPVSGPAKTPMIKIGRNKLIRASAIPSKSRTVGLIRAPKLLTPSKRRPPVVNEKYKIDRRTPRLSNSTKLVRRQSFESKYALRRSSVSENLVSKKLVVTKRKLLKIGSPNKGKFHISSPNKKLELLNINGVLYRSTKNKLQKADSSCQSVADAQKLAPNSGRSVFIKGDKFILDKSGKSLTRVEVPSAEKMKLKRIDIGGLTYVAKSNNVFVRTNIHKTRNHLNLAKQKSINTLSKNLVKTNIPCPIYRKVGKCASFDRGKCPKLHDKKQISICPKFLKGECSNEKCLLSHDVNLSKMPTCKFYLQGICVRENCPYLHKKLAENAEICLEFLRGFCQLANKCNKRHEFVCPNFEKTGKCDKVKCEYCSKRKKAIEENSVLKENPRAKRKEKPEVVQIGTEEKSLTSRYFVDECNDNTSDYLEEQKVIDVQEDDSDESTCVLKRRPKLGVLPAFIPL